LRGGAGARRRRAAPRRRGGLRLVLLEEPGRPLWGVERPEDEVRAALDALISK
jgi:hypothetical protein